MQDILELFRLYKKYDEFSDPELRLYLFPSLNLRQCKKHYDGEELIGFTNWAFLSDKAQHKFIKTGFIDKYDWKSGNNIWHIETVAKKNLKEIMSWTKNYFSSIFETNTPVSWLRIRNNKPYRKATRHTKEHYKWAVQ
jgi:hemolysin-activating ACP:hemolysin acyltransferase